MKIQKQTIKINGKSNKAYVFKSYSDLFNFVYNAMTLKAANDHSVCSVQECKDWMEAHVEKE